MNPPIHDVIDMTNRIHQYFTGEPPKSVCTHSAMPHMKKTTPAIKRINGVIMNHSVMMRPLDVQKDDIGEGRSNAQDEQKKPVGDHLKVGPPPVSRYRMFQRCGM